MRAALSGLLLLPAAALRVGVSPVRPVRRTPGFVRSAVSADLPATHASEDEFEVTKAEVARIRKELRAKETELSRTRAELESKEKLLARLDTSTTATVVYRESTQRSLVKAIGWRFTAGLVTFFSSLMFTKGNLRVALAIVSSDFLSKSGTMFIGERLWNKSNVGRSSKGTDNVARSFAKAIVWRLFAMVNTMCVAGFLTGGAAAAAKIATFDGIVKTTLMVTYDQMWNRVDWGKELENVAGDGI